MSTGADELAGLKLPKWNLTFSPEKVEKLQQFNFTEVDVTLNCVENCNLIDDPGSLQLVLTNEKANIASLQVKVCNYISRAFMKNAICVITKNT